MTVKVVAQEGSRVFDGLEYKAEMQATISDGDNTPLWLNANKYGLSSLETSNGYLRAALIRPIEKDSDYVWGLGYGLDLAVAHNFTSRFVAQQAYVEGRWKKGVLTIGSKEMPMEMKNQKLSSGSQTLGINARPIPQVRLALADYWSLPVLNGWLGVKGHVAYGRLTDDNWERDFTEKKSKYAENVLYHSKAAYLKIGNDELFCPFSLEMGLEMASLFGGKAYQVAVESGEKTTAYGRSDLKAFVAAFIGGGTDVGEFKYPNAQGDHLGSWVIRANYDVDEWGFSLYYDHFFEDHSGMFFLDYDGYGSGEEWDDKKDFNFLVYNPLKDMLVGAELRLKDATLLNNILFEYIYTKYQSGPIYHDHTRTISDHIGGVDEYYNHYFYGGWQHWGQVIGNPLYRSPIYNSDGKLEIKNNRFYAFHLGLSGEPEDNISYRILATYQKGWGTYTEPFANPQTNFSLLAEGTYRFRGFLDGWSLTGALAMDKGGLLGDNMGAQITICKRGLIK